VLALQLLGRWTRIAQGHIPIGAACSCGAGGSAEPLSLSAAALEPDLMGYLLGRFGTAGGVQGLFEPLDSSGQRGDADVAPSDTSSARSCGLAELLTRVARSRAAGASIRALLAQIDSSLESFERAHKGTL
jgi:hypothetical protein